MALGATLVLAGCADGRPGVPNPPLTPTEQFAIKVAPTQDQIMLAPHAEGLSSAQAAALNDLVDRWRDQGSGDITVQSPAHGGEDAYRAASAVQDALVSMGVEPDKVRLTDYDPGAQAHAPIMVAYTRYQASGPVCGRNWDSFTHTGDNRVDANYGCATTANMAAQIDNAGDLVAPRDVDPADPGRRAIVLNHYRKGENTSSAKDSQANGTVSSVGQ
jgi:pilus assembly protein CpaD